MKLNTFKLLQNGEGKKSKQEGLNQKKNLYITNQNLRIKLKTNKT